MASLQCTLKKEIKDFSSRHEERTSKQSSSKGLIQPVLDNVYASLSTKKSFQQTHLIAIIAIQI